MVLARSCISSFLFSKTFIAASHEGSAQTKARGGICTALRYKWSSATSSGSEDYLPLKELVTERWIEWMNWEVNWEKKKKDKIIMASLSAYYYDYQHRGVKLPFFSVAPWRPDVDSGNKLSLQRDLLFIDMSLDLTCQLSVSKVVIGTQREKNRWSCHNK